jgi:hypothetical protein
MPARCPELQNAPRDLCKDARGCRYGTCKGVAERTREIKIERESYASNKEHVVRALIHGLKGGAHRYVTVLHRAKQY